MNIFFSWSKKKSRDLAIVTKNFIEGLFRSDIKIWISSEDIDYGAMAMVDINKALKDSDMCIAFIVEENLSSPWIMFETGAIAGRMHLEKNHTIENTVVYMYNIIRFRRRKMEKINLKDISNNIFFS
mgnify:CR=1 FL=1